MNLKINTFLIFKILLGVQTAYLIVALLTGALPGWSMFAHLDNPAYAMTDMDQGQIINAALYLPEAHFELGPDTLKQLATFICRKDQVRIRLEIKTAKVENYEITPKLCAGQPR